ncbi:phage protease [Novosphingobium sp. NDB2Meth1]|uniref:phage protease n=1 Tax=Novosphingobium sp. NDB2Meth1 TaxID=1892847 RepID=UPI0009F83484|nr:phage protease [Novosphingobium sp. NDB2Meth1]
MDVDVTMQPVALDTAGQAAYPPREVKLLPFGNPFYGRDGRGPWVLRDRAQAERVLALTKQVLGGVDMVVDYDHATELAAPQGKGRAIAAGWVRSLYIADDGIWASIEWTAQASAEILARQYRYISPHFRVDKLTREVTRIVNAGLTNTPNLELPALASYRGKQVTEEERAICAALGVTEADYLAQKILDSAPWREAVGGGLTSEEIDILARTGVSEKDYLATKAKMAR